MSTPIGTDIAGYYQLHAPIYDLTRPLFLFGRARLVADLARICRAQGLNAPSILEVGCGTGTNLALLRREFPNSRLVGVDLAAPMLARAQRRMDALEQRQIGERRARGAVELIQGALGSVRLDGPFDLVVASYMLSMTGAAQAQCIAAARAELAGGGLLGVVDFHTTPSAAFARWMAHNHVHFAADLPARLAAGGAAIACDSRRAYAGAWRYLSWIGH